MWCIKHQKISQQNLYIIFFLEFIVFSLKKKHKRNRPFKIGTQLNAQSIFSSEKIQNLAFQRFIENENPKIMKINHQVIFQGSLLFKNQRQKQ